MARTITENEKSLAQGMLQKARLAMCVASDYDQERVDDLCRAVGWATANERTFVALTETAGILRATLKREGAPEDLVQCIDQPSIPLAQELMSICDLTVATGGSAMVKAAYGSGKPAYGVGAGNATMIIDETADIAEAAANTRISKTHNNGSGCSCDGNLIVEDSIHDAFLAQLQKEGGYLTSAEEKEQLRAVMWDA